MKRETRGTKKLPESGGIAPTHMEGLAAHLSLVKESSPNLSDSQFHFRLAPPFLSDRHGCEHPGTNRSLLVQKNFRLTLAKVQSLPVSEMQS